MASIFGFDGSFWLVAVLLVLAFGLAVALVKATLGSVHQVRERRPR